MLLLLIVLILIFGSSGAYLGHVNYGPWGGSGIGLGTVLLIIFIFWILGWFQKF